MAMHLTSHRMRFTSGSYNRIEEELFGVLEQYDWADIQRYLDTGDVQLDCRNDSGYTLLGVAAQNGHVMAGELLIQYGNSVNEPDFYGQTPLQYAAEYGHVTMLDMLVENGANVNWMDTNKDGLSALHLATLNGNVEIVKALIKAKCDVNVKDINRVTALHCAVANCHHRIVTLLLQAHARLNVRGIKSGRTPLFVAAEVGELDLVNKLLKRGARVNTKDDYGMTPLCAVCLQNNTDAAQILMDAGANINIADNTGSLPLHYVARFGNLDVMEGLVAKGSDLNHLNKNNDTPLHLAIRMEHVRAAKLLVQNGCDVNVCDPHGMVTALHAAVSACTDLDNFSTLLETLIMGGCMLDIRAFVSMETALYQAINLDKTHFAMLLLQHGADPNLDCQFDITILQKACEKNIPELTETLLHSRIDWTREVWLDSDIHMSGINPKLLAGYAEHIPSVLLNNIDLYIKILEVRRNPPLLMDACRWVIREHMGSKLHVRLEHTHLPHKLQEFVLMKML